MDMAKAENELIAEKKFRENSLSIQKKQIERIRAKDAGERHRRMVSPSEAPGALLASFNQPAWGLALRGPSASRLPLRGHSSGLRP